MQGISEANMTDLPEKIYVYPSMDETDFPCSKLCESSFQQEYIRADLVPTWRSMESAPKDGTPMLLDDGVNCFVASWSTCNMKGDEKGWVHFALITDWNDYFTVDDPVRWMPIPK
jgi:hypothetical protein